MKHLLLILSLILLSPITFASSYEEVETTKVDMYSTNPEVLLASFHLVYAIEYRFADEFIYKIALCADGSEKRLDTYTIITDDEQGHNYYCTVVNDEYQIELIFNYKDRSVTEIYDSKKYIYYNVYLTN